MRRLWRNLLLVFGALATAVFFCSSALAAQKVTLLMGFDPADSPHLLMRMRFKDYDQKIADSFEKDFKNTDFEPNVVTFADQYDLYSALQDPENVAVFWISHGALAAQSYTGIEQQAGLLDRNNFDVTPVLSAVGPSIRYLALIGCDSQQILSDKDGRIGSGSLVVKTFSTKIELKTALSSALQQFLAVPASASDAVAAPDAAPVQMVQIVRTIPSDAPNQNSRHRQIIYPAVRIEVGGQLMSVLPASWPGMTNDETLEIPTSLLEDSGWKITVDAGDRLETRDDDPAQLGDFSFASPDSEAGSIHWKAKTDFQGQILGTTLHVYVRE